MTHTHKAGRTRLFVLLALLASAFGLTAVAIPASPAQAAVVANASGSCSGATTWTAGTYYNVGAIVEYPSNGDYYIATNANPGTTRPSAPGTGRLTPAPAPAAVAPVAAAPRPGLPERITTSVRSWSIRLTAITTSRRMRTRLRPDHQHLVLVAVFLHRHRWWRREFGGFVVSQAQFDQMFPDANSFYTYSGLVSAFSEYPAFATTGGTTVEEQEAAAFLANVDHETGGLVYINEIDQSGDYCASESYGCPPAPPRTTAAARCRSAGTSTTKQPARPSARTCSTTRTWSPPTPPSPGKPPCGTG
jgi:hypothetical protein